MIQPSHIDIVPEAIHMTEVVDAGGQKLSAFEFGKRHEWSGQTLLTFLGAVPAGYDAALQEHK